MIVALGCAPQGNAPPRATILVRQSSMNDKTKRILFQIGAFLTGMLVGGALTIATEWGVSSQKATTPVVQEPSPVMRRAQNGDTFTIWNISPTENLNVWANGFVNESIEPNSSLTLTWTNSYNYWLVYEQEDWMLVGTSAGNWNRLDRGYEYEITDSVNLFVVDTTSPNVTIHNEFVRATGENLEAVDDNLQTKLLLSGQSSQEVAIDQVRDCVFLHSPAEDMFIGTPSDHYAISGSTAVRNWTADVDTLIEYPDIYFYPARQSWILWNATLAEGEVIYSLTLGDMTTATNWHALRSGEKVSIYQGENFTYRSSVPFQAVYGSQTFLPSYEGNNVDSPLHGYYFVQVEGVVHDLKIEPVYAGGGGEGETLNALSSTLALIATAFSSLMPILNIQVFGGITIGFLALIPLTGAIIALIFRLIKK